MRRRLRDLLVKLELPLDGLEREPDKGAAKRMAVFDNLSRDVRDAINSCSFDLQVWGLVGKAPLTQLTMIHRSEERLAIEYGYREPPKPKNPFEF